MHCEICGKEIEEGKTICNSLGCKLAHEEAEMDKEVDKSFEKVERKNKKWN